MASALQNRLVGTVIIVALAVILLPDFLDGKKVTNEDVFVTVPTPPAKKPILTPEPFPESRVVNAAQRPVEVVEERPVDETPLNDAAGQANDILAMATTEEDDLASQTVIDKPEVDREEGAGWVIQLGSFRHQKNVKQLLNKLESAGYRAFSRPIQTSSGLLTKVFVGPELDKKKLEAALPHLLEVTNLKGKVTEFKVE